MKRKPKVKGQRGGRRGSAKHGSVQIVRSDSFIDLLETVREAAI